MPTNSKNENFEKSLRKSLNRSPKEIFNKNICDNEEVTTVFNDFHISALSKAANISSSVKYITLGKNSTEKEEKESNDNLLLNKTNRCKSQIKKHIKTKTQLNFPESNFPEQKLNNNLLSFEKLLHEYDNQRRLTVDKVMRERIQNMYDTEKLIRHSLEHLKQTRLEEVIARRALLEQKIIDDILQQCILNKPEREAQLAKENLKEAQRVQERNQKVKEAEEEAKKKSEAIIIKRNLIDKILLELQKEYNQEYKNMLETIKLCQDKAALSDLTASQSKMLKDCALVCESLLKKCKQGDVSADDVESAKKLVETLKSIHQCFKNEIIKINQSLNSVDVKSEKNEQNQASDRAFGESSSLDLSDCFDSKSFYIYLKLRSQLKDVEKTLQPLLCDDSMKNFRFSCQKAVTIPVNAISPISSSHLSDKYFKLYNLLSGRVVEVGDTKVTASAHPLGIIFCKNLLAKKFVRQGDLTVSSKPDAAFSIATVLASLWVDFPDFGQLVLAHFQSACPYLAPVFMPQVEGQSDEDYHKSLGYHYFQNGEVEKQDSFLKRMSGIMRLYSALIISKVRQPGKMNPLGLSEGWRWISALLNLEPRPDICATLLYDFLEVAGNEMFRVYGGQFKKMLAYICQEYFPKLEKVTPATAGGPLVRLESFLQKVLKDELIPPPHGVLSPNFW